MPNASDIITYGTAGIGALVVSTGTGSNVLADTPTLVTPILGTPTSGNLANCTGYPTTAGALVLLEQHTASASASLVFTTGITSTYDDYVFEILGIQPATAAASLLVRVSTDGGATYDATANNYHYGHWFWSTGNASSVLVNSVTATAWLVSTTMNTTAASAASGTIKLYAPGSTTLHKVIDGQLSGQLNSSNGFRYRADLQGVWVQTTAVNAIQFLFDSGNIAIGTIRLYGMAKS